VRRGSDWPGSQRRCGGKHSLTSVWVKVDRTRASRNVRVHILDALCERLELEVLSLLAGVLEQPLTTLLLHVMLAEPGVQLTRHGQRRSQEVKRSSQSVSDVNLRSRPAQTSASRPAHNICNAVDDREAHHS
jgi:hypothetical protein